MLPEIEHESAYLKVVNYCVIFCNFRKKIQLWKSIVSTIQILLNIKTLCETFQNQNQKLDFRQVIEWKWNGIVMELTSSPRWYSYFIRLQISIFFFVCLFVFLTDIAGNVDYFKKCFGFVNLCKYLLRNNSYIFGKVM